MYTVLYMYNYIYTVTVRYILYTVQYCTTTIYHSTVRYIYIQ